MDAHSAEQLTEHFFGAPQIGAKQLTALSQVHFLDLEFRDNPLPQDMQQLRIGQEAGVRPRHLLWALVVGSVLAVAAAWWANLAIYYHYGAAGKVDPWYQEIGRRGYMLLDVRVDSAEGPNWPFVEAVGFGAGVTALLGEHRVRVGVRLGHAQHHARGRRHGRVGLRPRLLPGHDDLVAAGGAGGPGPERAGQAGRAGGPGAPGGAAGLSPPRPGARRSGRWTGR